MLGTVLPAWDKTKPFVISSIPHDQVWMNLAMKGLKVKQRQAFIHSSWMVGAFTFSSNLVT